MNKENLKFYLVFLFASILGISVDYLFHGKPVGISFFVFILIFVIFSLVLTKKFGEKLTKIQYLLLGTAILFSAMVFYRSSSFLTFFNIVSALFLFSLFFVLFSKEKLSDFNFLRYFISPLSFLRKSFGKSARFIAESIDRLQAKKKFGSPEFYSVVRGIVISLPILALLIWLLSSADIVFQKYLDKLLKVSINPEIVLRILIVFVASYFFVGIFAKTFTNQKSPNSLIENNQSKFLGPIESFIVIGAVELLFLVFILIQFFYLFGGKEYVWGIEEYITYSEYARKGFGELIAVSIISFLLVYGIDKFGKRENILQKRIFKILGSVLVFELFIIIASSFKRLSLYVDGYGYTLSRLLSSIFLFWLFFVFLLFIYKILWGTKETLFLYSAFWLTIVFLIVLNIFNPDVFIAKENIQRYVQKKQQWEQLDAWYLSELSEDAIPETVKIFDMEINEEIKTDIAMNLDYKYSSYHYYLIDGEEIPFDKKLEEIRKNRKWQSFNLSQDEALMVLTKNMAKIKEYQAKYWEKEARKCKEDLEKCEKECEKRFAENPEEAIRCKDTESYWIKERCELYKEKARKQIVD